MGGAQGASRKPGRAFAARHLVRPRSKRHCLSAAYPRSRSLEQSELVLPIAQHDHASVGYRRRPFSNLLAVLHALDPVETIDRESR